MTNEDEKKLEQMGFSDSIIRKIRNADPVAIEFYDNHVTVHAQLYSFSVNVSGEYVTSITD